MKIFRATFLEWWKQHNREFRALLFDIDGTLIAGKKIMPGVPELIRRLENKKFPFFLLTNDGNRSTEEKSEIMKKAGLPISPDRIISCGMAIAPFAEKYRLKGKKFFVMGELGNPDYATRAGLKVERDTEKINGCAGVIVGEGVYNWQSNINSALNFFIKYPKRFLVVPNPDSYWPDGSKGEIGIGAGGKARFLCTILEEYGVRKKPLYLGKPYRAIFNHAFELLIERYNLIRNIPKDKILVLGDSLRSDIRGANDYGFFSGLVLTGITTRQHLKMVKTECVPDFVFPRIN